jgi:serine/threonine protein kinase
VQGFQAEYSILKAARESNLSYLMPLEKVTLGPSYVALHMEKFDMTLREYLRRHRDYRTLNKILCDVAIGLIDLHKHGYAHRDLKPENIMIDLKPIRVRIIDFNCALPTKQATTGLQHGTPGYYPDARNLADGSPLWDVWALGAIVLECDMEADAYLRVNTERFALKEAEKHLEGKGCSKFLKAIVRGTILCGRVEEMISLNVIVDLLLKVQFQRRDIVSRSI